MKTNWKIGAAVVVLLLAPMAACSTDAPSEAGEGEAAVEEKGPHRGKMLRDGDFAVEMTVFEDGVPPEFRVYPTRDGKPETRSLSSYRDA